MNQVALSLFVGLVAGLGGGYVGQMLAEKPTVLADDIGIADDGTLAARLERIEALLEDRTEPMTLEGRADAPFSAGSPTVTKIAMDDALLAALDEKVRTAVKESVAESFESMDAESVEFDPTPMKEMTLAEVAVELELSAEEEAAVRTIHQESMEKMLELMVGEDETVDDVRRELEEARDDPAKSAAIVGKYMGRAMTNLGGFIGLMMSHEQKMSAALGAEKSSRFDDYEVTDLDPYGIEALFDGMGG